MSDCLFCKIIAGAIPSNPVYEDEWIYAFRDIAPQAPTHILVVPKAHIADVNGITEENSAIIAHIFTAIPQIARAAELTDGYRVVTNCGVHGCQSVQHLHFHILGGRQLSGEMG
ncbi:MAG TPA: histidine triad nucleotide-binding protein [Candidatus Faecousia intestinigallinarum]|nr:histidine triad nucleotide-binding protein [Candidatus Faecousia intestinigallinarum]